jgi:hypothetical protein
MVFHVPPAPLPRFTPRNVFEHGYPDESNLLLQEYFRVFKPSGGVRLIVPNLESPIEAYRRNQSSRFDDSFPRHFDSLGGRFFNFIFCDVQHRGPFDSTYFDEVVRKAEFREVERAAEGKSRPYKNWVPPYEPGDSPDFPRSQYVEAFK